MSDRKILFAIDRYGWLTYEPFNEPFRLPHLDFASEEERERDSSAATFRLFWPGLLLSGESRQDDSIPEQIVAVWPKQPGTPAVDGRYSLSTLIEVGLPDEVPEALAYHLAINRATYNIDRPVAGLPPAFVRSILEHGQFLLNAKDRGAATYLKFLAETHWGHPLLLGFDTIVRERFLEICLEATRLFFYALGDRLVAKDARELWDKLATYFFWVGRTGMGLYSQHAGLRLENLERMNNYQGESIESLVERLRAWSSRGNRDLMKLVRRYSQAAATRPPT
jgi:hypothetical protein